jgi:hypothetical protein
MTDSEYEALIATLQKNDRAILDELRRRGSVGASVSDVRPVTLSPQTGKPLAYGLTRELERLQGAGLVRLVGKNPARYAVVSLADVEKAATAFRLKSNRKKKKKKTAGRTRIAELRKYEHGDYSEFYRVYRRVIELSEYVSKNLPKMAFWEVAPKDELARVVEELADLRDALDSAFVLLEQRADDDELIAKIAKLEETKGRTDPEAETARTLAKKLRRQYDQRIGVLD